MLLSAVRLNPVFKKKYSNKINNNKRDYKKEIPLLN